MKKMIASLAVFFLVLSVPSVIAQMPLAVPAMPSASMALERIGVVAAAQGKVELTTPGQIGRIAQSGQAIFMGDEVTTDEKGQLQILLLDETVFKIGPNSSIIIDKFVYDPKTSAGEIKASITKGVFRYVSGKIAAKNPDSVKVKLPTATIGFRGTIVGGSVEPSGQGLVGLLGPGDNNDSGARVGSFTIDGEGGGQQEVNRSGFGVEVDGNGGISDVFQLSDDQINGLTGGLGGDQGGGSGEGGDAGLGGDPNMGDLSGENNALTGANTLLLGGLENFSDSLSDVSVIGAQDARDQSGAVNPNGTTRVSDLSGLSGSYSYSGSGSFTQTLLSGITSNITGSFTASWVLNLATAQLTNIQIEVNTDSPYSGNISNYDAAVTHSIPASDLLVFSGLHDPSYPNIQAEITISNANGQIAQNGTINVVYNDNATSANEGSGSATISHA